MTEQTKTEKELANYLDWKERERKGIAHCGIGCIIFFLVMIGLGLLGGLIGYLQE